jgi:ribulose-5-phosphate 4-epimerase/fuculose-1-phosphate aldolase
VVYSRSEKVARSARVVAATLECSWGFVAVRDEGGGGFWITPDRRGLDEVTASDMSFVSTEAPTGDAEVDLALFVFDQAPDAHAVVHAHSLYATAFAGTGWNLSALSHEGCHVVPLATVRWGESPEAGGGYSGLEPSEYGGPPCAALTPGHGVVTWAGTLGEASALASYVEKACRVHLLAGQRVLDVGEKAAQEKRLGQLSRPRITWEYLERVLV